jgi:Tfp pilus assembly protein PilO
MRTGQVGHADRLWLIGGALGAAALLAVGWFFFINPQNDETSNLRDQADTAQLRLTSLEHRLEELRQQNKNLPRYRARLALDRQALPTTSALSDFLRQLQTAGDATGVDVNGVIVGSPAQVSAGGAQLHALPITLTAAGRVGDVDRFLDELQKVQPRAVLISTANIAADEGAGAVPGSVTLTLNLQVFVAPATTTQ